MKVAGALLAAGGSSRFGRPKAFAELAGKTLLRRVAEAMAPVVSPLLVVTPPAGGGFALELSGLGARIVVNRLPQRGIGSSIATAARALAAIAPESEALLVALVDQPLVDRELFERLIGAARGGTSGLAACDFGDGRPSVPALFPKSCFDELTALTGDRGARSVLEARRDQVALVPFPDGAFDVDTPADLERLSSRLAPGAPHVRT